MEEALSEFTKTIQYENGLVSIGIVALKIAPFRYIAVNLEKKEMIPYFKKKYGVNWNMGKNGKAQIEYSVSAPNITHIGSCGKGVANKSRVLGNGTLGCYLSRHGSDKKYLLSCWHVLKDNADWKKDPYIKEVVEPNIDRNLDVVIGSIVDGGISDTFDIGIAECNDNNVCTNIPLPVKTQHRAVLPYDALVNTEVTILGNVSKQIKATIYLDQVNAVLEYKGENTKRIINDTFSITRVENGQNVAPTSEGDSGALVVDGNSTPLGMIIGGNDHVSYAIKFTNVFSENKIYGNYSFITT